MIKNKCKRKRYLLLLGALAVCTWLFAPGRVYAAEAYVTFGSDSYESEIDAAFPIGVYIESDEQISGYTVLIRYDAMRLEYLAGADEADTLHGIITLSGSDASSNEVKYWLTFRVISGGEANIAVTDAVVYGADGEGSAYTITELGYAPISLAGADVAAGSEIVAESEDAEEGEIAEGTEGDTQQSETADAVGDGESGIQGAAVDDAADSGESADVEETEEEGVSGDDNKPGLLLNPLVAVGIPVVILLIAAEVIALFVLRKRDRIKRRQKHREGLIKATRSAEASRIAALEEYYPEIDHVTEERLRAERGEPVISVNDVTMEFKLYQNIPSGLKEYLIQLVRREVTYRRLYALYHVSFDVFKGEVVGIIGTNGSGKSTVLKIVSGALLPTGGDVAVDRDKLQILTLGTGFDMELSARENVYLNGAIIGYSREFIDEHFDEIVDFAELWDFMDEKVKNFSSGMVSRLGFAIATAGDAAEILILDEVLSVGDEFFRKKSLERIKEMIHGGSTVLMVSHGLGTIIEHCTKAIWIEKGQLRMIGDPKHACEAYKKMGGE